jgi:DNA-binding transcriptional regulator PaaX
MGKMKVSPTTKKFLIYLLITGGVVALSILAPQLPYAILRAYFRKKKFDRGRFKHSLNRLRDQKLLIWKEIGDQIEIKITEKGKQRALRFKFEEMEIPKPEKWDEKWRMVIFDIPEKKKLARNVLRDKLKQLGFYRLQKSVFIYPYECQEIISFFREIYEVRSYVHYLVIESVENEENLKEYFNLP